MHLLRNYSPRTYKSTASASPQQVASSTYISVAANKCDKCWRIFLLLLLLLVEKETATVNASNEIFISSVGLERPSGMPHHSVKTFAQPVSKWRPKHTHSVESTTLWYVFCFSSLFVDKPPVVRAFNWGAIYTSAACRQTSARTFQTNAIFIIWYKQGYTLLVVACCTLASCLPLVHAFVFVCL